MTSGSAGRHFRDQFANQRGLAGVPVAGRLQGVRFTGWIAYGDHENPIAVGIQARRLQIELHSAQVVE